MKKLVFVVIFLVLTVNVYANDNNYLANLILLNREITKGCFQLGQADQDCKQVTVKFIEFLLQKGMPNELITTSVHICREACEKGKSKDSEWLQKQLEAYDESLLSIYH